MRAYELTEAQGSGFKIFCDMDGVLVDFRKGVGEFMADPQYGEEYTVQNYVIGRGPESKVFWKKLAIVDKVAPEETRAIWENLEWLPDGKKLWSYISKYDPVILSSPGKTSADIIIDGKKQWLDNHLGGVKSIFETDKWKYAKGNAGTQHILIDDTANKINPWVEHGGIGILHTSASNTIKELKKWGL